MRLGTETGKLRSLPLDMKTYGISELSVPLSSLLAQVTLVFEGELLQIAVGTTIQERC